VKTLLTIISLSFALFSCAHDPQATWSGLNTRAVNLYQQGRFTEAAVFAEDALGRAEKDLGPNHLNVSQSLNNLAGIYSAMGEYEKAEPIYTRALKIREETLGPTHPALATTLNNLAELYRSRGDPLP
jgi:tetratricopeptide (TPR) repeat protein